VFLLIRIYVSMCLSSMINYGLILASMNNKLPKLKWTKCIISQFMEFAEWLYHHSQWQIQGVALVSKEPPFE